MGGRWQGRRRADTTGSEGQPMSEAVRQEEAVGAPASTERRSFGFKVKTRNPECYDLGFAYTKVHTYDFYGKTWTYTHTSP